MFFKFVLGIGHWHVGTITQWKVSYYSFIFCAFFIQIRCNETFVNLLHMIIFTFIKIHFKGKLQLASKTRRNVAAMACVVFLRGPRG
jgi:hypothetical protein